MSDLLMRHERNGDKLIETTNTIMNDVQKQNVQPLQSSVCNRHLIPKKRSKKMQESLQALLIKPGEDRAGHSVGACPCNWIEAD